MKRVEDRASPVNLRKLLRYLSAGPVQIDAGVAGCGTVGLIRCNGGSRRLFPSQLIDEALSRDLAFRHRDVMALTGAGEDWLKRAMCESEMPFAAQHGEHVRMSIETEDGHCRPVTVNASESPLSGLRRLKGKDGRPFLDTALFEAGERLRADFTRGQLQPRISANWEASVAGGGRGANGIADLSDSALAARMRVEKALAAVGPELSGILVDVCCFLKGFEAVERERQWPVRSAKLMLKTALSVLDRHYRPERDAVRQAHIRRNHRWGADGYKPVLRRS